MEQGMLLLAGKHGKEVKFLFSSWVNKIRVKERRETEYVFIRTPCGMVLFYAGQQVYYWLAIWGDNLL